jgi:hypothetical protein
MATVTSLLTWVFVHTIYGIIGVGALLYLVLKALKKWVPSIPEPMYVVIPIVLVGMFTLPSIPCYQFERETLAKVEGKGLQ